jgi:hypothetical protein
MNDMMVCCCCWCGHGGAFCAPLNTAFVTAVSRCSQLFACVDVVCLYVLVGVCVCVDVVRFYVLVCVFVCMYVLVSVSVCLYVRACLFVCMCVRAYLWANELTPCSFGPLDASARL